MNFNDIFKSSFLENIAGVSLLDMALAVYHSGHTFGKMGMEPYIPQN